MYYTTCTKKKPPQFFKKSLFIVVLLLCCLLLQLVCVFAYRYYCCYCCVLFCQLRSSFKDERYEKLEPFTFSQQVKFTVGICKLHILLAFAKRFPFQQRGLKSVNEEKVEWPRRTKIITYGIIGVCG